MEALFYFLSLPGIFFLHPCRCSFTWFTFFRSCRDNSKRKTRKCAETLTSLQRGALILAVSVRAEEGQGVGLGAVMKSRGRRTKYERRGNKCCYEQTTLLSGQKEKEISNLLGHSFHAGNVDFCLFIFLFFFLTQNLRSYITSTPRELES